MLQHLAVRLPATDPSPRGITYGAAKQLLPQADGRETGLDLALTGTLNVHETFLLFLTTYKIPSVHCTSGIDEVASLYGKATQDTTEQETLPSPHALQRYFTGSSMLRGGTEKDQVLTAVHTREAGRCSAKLEQCEYSV